jgi:hypothetical protein
MMLIPFHENSSVPASVAETYGHENILLYFLTAYRDSSFGTATGYGLDDRGSISGGSCETFSSTPRPDWLWGPPSLLSNGYWGKAAGR